MKLRKWLVIVFFITKIFMVHAQENNPLVLGIGVNIVDNSGSRFDELLDIENNWNLSRLLKVTLEKRFDYDYGAELSLSINRFTEGKVINGIVVDQKTNYFAIDIMAKNYTSNYWQDPRHAWYNGYVIGGWGGNFFDTRINNTLNIGFGINFQLKKNQYLWINFQTLGKFSIDANTPGNANHLQHSISIIFWLL
ncbi:hypothetical protein [Aquimarina pacifica]|uniref:hypothetical protein n=1 Tax=Aquimarina pacifica TaxID=1296415 RepID=UPI0004719F40|nr:hypothetical protein [Aquimarina pacifica]